MLPFRSSDQLKSVY